MENGNSLLNLEWDTCVEVGSIQTCREFFLVYLSKLMEARSPVLGRMTVLQFLLHIFKEEEYLKVEES